MICPLECTVGALERRLGRKAKHSEIRKECAILAKAGELPKDLDCPHCFPSYSNRDNDRDDSPLLMVEDGSDVEKMLRVAQIPEMVVV